MPKISELPLANKLKEEDYIPIVQDGVTKKVKGTHFVTEEEYSLDAFSPTIAANDRTMYKFGEGDTVDFSDSAYDGAYKSAILKGNTLVNISPLSGEITISPNSIQHIESSLIKQNTTFTFMFNCTSIPSTGFIEFRQMLDNTALNIKNINIVQGCNKFKVTTVNTELNRFRFKNDSTSETDFVFNNLLILEGDYTNIDIPYFEGMQSVRMPVLTTTGKNLFDGEVEGGSFDNWGNKTDSYNSKRSINLIEVKPNTKYKIVKPFADWHSIIGFKENDFSKPINDSIGSHAVIDSNTSQIQEFTTSPTTKFLALVCVDSIDISQTMIVAGSETNYTFEPHKSNILSTNEEVELRGIGEVRDELDLLTGEVTEATGVYSFTGNETFTASTPSDNEELLHFSCNVPTTNNKSKYGVISNYLPKSTSLKSEGIFNDWGWFNIVIRKDKLSSPTTSGFKEKLKEWFDGGSPLQAVYILPEKVHKTVDLSGTPFGYKGGHIIKSSAEGSLLPKFEYEVAVSRGAQISQNTSTLIKHDEKITELLKKTAATYINQKAEIAYLLNMSSTLEEAQTIPFIEDDYVNDDCMVDSDMVMDNMEVEPEKEIIDNVDTLLINLIYDLIELNDTLGLSEKVELFRQSGLIDKHNYEIIKEKLNPTFKEEDYADINQ